MFGAIDPHTGVGYLYHEYYRSQAEAVIHAAAIKASGDWIPGVVDPACLGTSAIDGRSLMEMYGKLGLDLQPALNAVESGIQELHNALSGGRLKVFETMPRWINEYRNYHRDEKGRIVKKDESPDGCYQVLVDERAQPGLHRAGREPTGGIRFQPRGSGGMDAVIGASWPSGFALLPVGGAHRAPKER